MKITPGTKLYIAVPAFGAQVHAQFVSALLQTSNTLTRMGMDHVVAFVGDSLITRARNVLVARFMATDFTHLMFIDADIEWKPEDVLRLLAASSVHDVCCGIYPKKCMPPEFPVNFLPGSNSALNQHPETGYVEIKDAPTGFLLIKRPVFRQMMCEYPERKCGLRQDCPPLEEPFEFALFDCMIDANRRYLSEDFGFSRLYQAIGGQIWMDPQINLVHYGMHGYKAEISTLLVPAGKRPTRAEDISGWMTEQELQFLRGAAGNVDSVAEVGSWKGRSTFALLEGCAGLVYAVDHWKGSEGERGASPLSPGPHGEAVTGDVFGQFMTNVGHFENLRVVKAPSLEGAVQVPDVDMVFIDAGHTYPEVVADIRAWRPRARKLICGHDFSPKWPDVIKAVRDELGEPDGVVGSIWYKEVA